MSLAKIISICLIFHITCNLQENRATGYEIDQYTRHGCRLKPAIYGIVQYKNCNTKLIPSFVCVGQCTSYVQVSGSKVWQMERSCNCCQESGVREAYVVLSCPKARDPRNRYEKVITKAPLECMCRPCDTTDEGDIIPQDIAGYSNEGPLTNHFITSVS